MNGTVAGFAILTLTTCRAPAASHRHSGLEGRRCPFSSRVGGPEGERPSPAVGPEAPPAPRTNRIGAGITVK